MFNITDTKGSNILLNITAVLTSEGCKYFESLEDVVAKNVEKLKKRYPGGEFDVYKSENGLVDDL